MYVISVGPSRTEMRTTLAGVLEFLNQDRRGVAAPRPQDISVRHVESGEIPVVPLKGGSLAVRPRGTARSILTRVLDEIERFVVCVDGKTLRPHEMSRSSWNSVVAAGRLAYFPEEAVDLATAEAGPLFHTRDLFEGEGPFDIADFVRGEFLRRFGYGTNGPLYRPDQGPNHRHELHVAYALLRGDKVRECVLNAYRDHPEHARYDLDWLRPLIEVPQLRGALSANQLQGLCRVMRHDKQEISARNALKLLSIVRRLSKDCTDVHVDDALFAEGILPPRAAPVAKPPQGGDATPVSELAERVHCLISQKRYAVTMAKATADREEMSISQREFDHRARCAANERACTGYGWANEVALAIMQRNVASVLEILDNPKDWNTESKRAIRDILGVDLLQCTAAVRRQRIFEMCGFSSDEQSAWEAHAKIAKDHARADEALAEARVLAEGAQIRIETGRVMNGRQYVEFCIAEGFTQLVDQPRGGARRYWMHNPDRGLSRPVRAKDGTLPYARACLERQPAALALAA